MDAAELRKLFVRQLRAVLVVDDGMVFQIVKPFDLLRRKGRSGNQLFSNDHHIFSFPHTSVFPVCGAVITGNRFYRQQYG